MARPSKKQLAEAAEAAKADSSVKVIDVDNFIRVRDSVFSRLSTIQELLKNFSSEYLRQTNLLLGEGTPVDPSLELAIDNVTGLLPPPGTMVPGLSPVPVAPALLTGSEKKERKKRVHDPNAPKRPLTPYFLYMQTARPIIANDLGQEVPKGAVQEEGQRRWSTMNAVDKAGWDRAYQYNLRLYNARVQAYKTGNLAARDMSDEDALRYADEFHIPMPTSKEAEPELANDQEAIAEQLQTTVEDDDTGAAAAAVKTPKKKESRKRKLATPGADAEPAKVPAATAAAAASAAAAAAAVAASTPASPEKKRKRATKAA